MKRSINYFIYKAFSLLFLFSFSLSRGQTPSPEEALTRAFSHSKTQKAQTPLQEVTASLEKAFQKEDNRFNRYWLSFGLYYQALFADSLEDIATAENLIDRAISLLKPLANDAESQALLSLQLGYSTRFKSYWSMISLGRAAYMHAEKAVALAPDNLRANLALALTDFYTPKMFGGGKKVVPHLTKALQAPSPEASSQLPRWGKPMVYELLVKYYQKNDQDLTAQNYLNQGLSEFPESELLLSLQ